MSISCKSTLLICPNMRAAFPAGIPSMAYGKTGPECGAAFVRADVMARLRGEIVNLLFDSKAARMRSAPPWWATVLALLAIALCISPQSILPNVNGHPPSLEPTLLFANAAARFLLRAIDWLRAPALYDLSSAPKQQFGWNWIVLPMVLLLFYLAAGTDLLVRLAFTASRPSLKALALQVILSHSPAPDQRVGLYSAIDIHPTPDGMTIRLKGHPDAGFSYTTTGKEPSYRHDTIWMGGGWYTFEGE